MRGRFRIEFIVVNQLASLFVHAGDVILEFTCFHSPLAASAHLDCGEFAAAHESVCLRCGDIERLGYVGQREESGCGHERIVPNQDR